MGAKISVFLYSLLAFGLQIVLLKVFEYLLLFNNIAEALPLGLLGASIGTILAALARKKFAQRDLESWGLLILAIALALLIPAVLYVAYLPLVLLSILCSAALGHLVAVNLLGHRFSAGYVFEILGSASGIILVWWLLPRIGAEYLFCVCVLLLSILAWWKKSWPALAIASALVISATLAASLGISLNLIHRIDPTSSFVPGSGRMALRQGPQAELLATKWSMLDRVDVIKYQDTISLFFNDRAWSSYQPRDPAAFPYSAHAKSALTIGVGAGRDVRDFWAAGIPRIVGAEISPEVVQLMRGPLRGLTDKIYDKAEIHVVNGRALLRRSKEKFDVILSHYPDLVAGGKIAHALAENYLWTQESFQEFLDHLTPGGQFIFSRTVRDERPFTFLSFQRYLATLAAGLQRAGVSAENHGYVVLTSPQRGQYKFHFVLKKADFTEEELEQLDHFFRKDTVVVRPKSAHLPPPAFLSKEAKSSFLFAQQLFAGQSAGWPAASELKNPATDDRPFLEYVGAQPLFSSFLMNVMLATLLVFAAILVLFANRLGLTLRASPSAQLHCFFSGAYFCLIEIYLIRRLNFHFGVPVRNMAFVLLTMLIGAAIAAGLLARNRNPSRPRWLAALSPLAALLFFALQSMMESAVSEPLSYGAFILLILPIGIFSSFVFPYFGQKFPQGNGLLYGLNLLGFFFGAAASLAIGLELGNQAIFFTALLITAAQSIFFFFSRAEMDSSSYA